MVNEQESLKNFIDALSFGTVIGTMAGVLPSVAAIFTIVWTGIRIYETHTFRKIFNIAPAVLNTESNDQKDD